MKTYRVGVAALVHDHVWGELRRWQALPNVQIVAAGDVNPELRERIRRDYGVEKTYDSWQEMLATEGESLDIVQIAAENSVHADIVETAATNGLHLLVEKPMAATLAQAERMVRAAEKADVRLMINWPTAWQPAFQEMERRILAGDIGQVRYFKYRSAHNGPKEIGCDPRFWEWLYDGEKNGAGAFMDYCCYGAAMAARFLGLPEKVTGLRGVLAKDYPLPDDNAIVTMQYRNALAVAEASWTQVTGYAGANPVAYGSEGALSILHGKVQLFKPGKDVETIEPAAPEAPHRSAPEYFIHCLETGSEIEGVCSATIGRLSQEILEAGLRAADTGQTQNLPIPIER
ncbi:MAG: Gfo/Idh/MocA family oxidoreductase [Capsulimonadales bacterium]|nr:Gfo/Idh/MocA family oxidoreductase [Capsulimonadales bacterium]